MCFNHSEGNCGNALKKKISEHLKHYICGKNTIYSQWRSTTSKFCWCHSSAVNLVLLKWCWCVWNEKEEASIYVCRVASLHICIYSKSSYSLLALTVLEHTVITIKGAPTHRVSVSSRGSHHWFGCNHFLEKRINT